MILATQTIDDFASADLLRTVVESCPTKLLLANPALDRRQYAELFQLNEMELDLLAGTDPSAADPVEAPGPDEGADAHRRSQELLDLHEHARSTTNAWPPCFENSASRQALDRLAASA